MSQQDNNATLNRDTALMYQNENILVSTAYSK